MAVFLSSVSQETFLDWGFPPLAWYTTVSLGKGPKPSEHNTRVLACWYAWLQLTPRKCHGVLHLSRSWCTSSGFLGGTGTRYSGHVYLSINFFLVTSHQGLVVSHQVMGRGTTAVAIRSGITETPGACCMVPLEVPLISGSKAISLFGIRTCSPGTTHWFSGGRWRSPVLFSLCLSPRASPWTVTTPLWSSLPSSALLGHEGWMILSHLNGQLRPL